MLTGITTARWTAIEVVVIGLAALANGCFLAPKFGHQALDDFFRDFGSAPYYALLLTTLALSRGYVARFLSTRVMVYLGEVSFAFYLVHQIVIRWYADHLSLFSPNASVRFAFVAIASAAAAVLIFHAIEKPCRRLIIDAWKKRASRDAVDSDPVIGSRV